MNLHSSLPRLLSSFRFLGKTSHQIKSARVRTKNKVSAISPNPQHPRPITVLCLLLLTLPLTAAPNTYVSLGNFSVSGRICPKIVSLVEEEGGAVDWGSKGWLAYDSFDPITKKYKVSLLLPDGKLGGSITNYRGPLARNEVGNPAWYPDGRFLVVQAADGPAPKWAVEKPALYRRISRPAVGYNNNLWLVAADGTASYPLTNLPTGSGAVRPRFSHRGDYLVWSELVSLRPQKWVMRLANFRLDRDGPHLGEIKTLDPVNAPFYEVSDFSPDDQSILFSTTAVENDYQHLAVARYDLTSKTTTFLTEANAEGRNQFARYSPSGRQIIWVSNREIPPRLDLPYALSEYWLMNADGTDKHRLTYFNQPEAPEYRDSANIAASFTWSPDGKSFVANLQLRTPHDSADDFISAILSITLPQELIPEPPRF